MQVTNRTTSHAAIFANEAYALAKSSYLSGSCTPRDGTGILQGKDLLGQMYSVYVCFPSALVVSPQPPSGCVFSTVLSHAGYSGWNDLWAMCLANQPDVAYPIPNRKVERTAQNAAVVASHHQLIKDIQESFGLHTIDLAEILQVSRQSVHSWKSDDGSVPSKTSAKKLGLLRDAAVAWRNAYPSSTPGWVLHSMVQGKTIKDWLALIAEGSADAVALFQGMSERFVAISSNNPRPTTRGREPTSFETFAASLKLGMPPARTDEP
jgi:DNA-binding transcriptional regulator YiaG